MDLDIVRHSTRAHGSLLQLLHLAEGGVAQDLLLAPLALLALVASALTEVFPHEGVLEVAATAKLALRDPRLLRVAAVG